MGWFWTAASLIIFLWVFQELISLKKKRNLPPGPFGLPMLGHLHLLGKNIHQDFHRLAKTYGPIIYLRLGLVPAVLVSSPAGAELVLKTHDLVLCSKPHSQASKHLAYDQKDIVFAPYGVYWRNVRKLCTVELLSNIRINQFQPMRRTELGLLVNSLRQSAEKWETVDISVRVSGMILDMMCLMVFGRKYGDGDFDGKAFKAVIDEASHVAALPNLGDSYPFMAALDLQGLDRRMKKVNKTFDEFLERIIDDHVQNKQQKKQNQDFVDTLMAILESGEAGFEFDRRHVKAILLDMFAAGVDTSVSAVEWTLCELIRHPEVMKKLQRELEQAIGMDKHVDESHLDKLEYLDSVVKETFRLHPPIPLIMHESLEDCTIDKFLIPQGSRIFVNLWSIGRDPNAWHDPENFAPERFVGSDVHLRGNHFQLLPFGTGRRSCPGSQLGLTTVRLVVAQLVHCFDWKLPDGMLPSDLGVAEHSGIVTSRDKHLMAIPTYRLHK